MLSGHHHHQQVKGCWTLKAWGQSRPGWRVEGPAEQGQGPSRGQGPHKQRPVWLSSHRKSHFLEQTGREMKKQEYDFLQRLFPTQTQ